MAQLQALGTAILHHLCPYRWRKLQEMRAEGNPAELCRSPPEHFCAAGLQWVQLQGYFSPALMCPLPKSSGSFPTACSRCSPHPSPTADGIRKLIQLEKNNNNSPHFLPLLQVFPTSYKTTHKYEGCSPDYAAPTLINTLSLKPTGRIRLAHTMNISSPLNYILI